MFIRKEKGLNGVANLLKHFLLSKYITADISTLTAKNILNVENNIR